MLIDSYQKDKKSYIIKLKGNSKKYKVRGVHTYATRLFVFLFSFFPWKLFIIIIYFIFMQ